MDHNSKSGPNEETEVNSVSAFKATGTVSVTTTSVSFT
jgi:hypothetical protein